MAKQHFNERYSGVVLQADQKDLMRDVRFCLARYGEDLQKVLAAFETEHGRLACVPLFCHGLAPRKELCTPESLTAAYLTVAPPEHLEEAWAALLTGFGLSVNALASADPSHNYQKAH
jgi:hypothetical protein